MRPLWIGTLLVSLVLPLAASGAAQEPEGPALTIISSEAEYQGPLLADEAIAGRRATAAGVLDSYNVWTTVRKPKLKANGEIVGHCYQICQNQRLIFANLLWVGSLSPVDVRLQLKLNKGGGSGTCEYEDLTLGFWMLSCEPDPGGIRPDYYKVTAKYSVTAGGSGSARETACFDLFSSC